MRTAQDFIDLTAGIQMDLRAAQAKMTELRAWIANLDLPADEKPFSEQRFLNFVANTAHIYTDDSLIEELAIQQGQPADPAFADKVRELAAVVRQRNAA